ncbi:MAG: hypothetical protein SFX74_10535 [Fimbriimonadaceae bacterium]|nr:hypothetical protein [Fimbriimonadaceae bacterium]
MLIARLCLALLFAGVSGLTFATPAKQELVTAIKAFERNTSHFRCQLAGERVSRHPDPVPSLRSSPTEIPLRTESISFRGTLEWLAPIYRAMLQVNGSDRTETVVFDGKEVVAYRGPERNPYGTHGTTNSARFGTLYPFGAGIGRFETGQLPLPEYPSLLEFARNADRVAVSIDASGVRTYRFTTEATQIEIDVLLPAEIRRFRFIKAEQTVREKDEYRLSDYNSLSGVRFPTRFSRTFQLSEENRLLTDDTFRWKFEKVELQASRTRILKPLPNDTLLSVYDGKAGGRVITREDKRVPVDPDYGTPGYEERIRNRNIMIGFAVLAAIGLIVLLLRKRYRATSSTHISGGD